MSKPVDDWLKDLVVGLPSYVKDSTHMLNIIEKWNVSHGPFPTNTKLVTIDVVGLYTNIPHADMQTAVKHFISESPQFDIPPCSVVIQVMNHILNNNTFIFENVVYKQEHGTAMGTPMAPSIANLFMGLLEKRMLAQSPIPINSTYWKRYIDYMCMLWTGTDEQLQVFINHINGFPPYYKFHCGGVNGGDSIP